MTLDEIARTYGIEDQVRDMPDLRRHWAMPFRPAPLPFGSSQSPLSRRIRAAVAIAIDACRSFGERRHCPTGEAGASNLSILIMVAAAAFMGFALAVQL